MEDGGRRGQRHRLFGGHLLVSHRRWTGPALIMACPGFDVLVYWSVGQKKGSSGKNLRGCYFIVDWLFGFLASTQFMVVVYRFSERM